MYKTTDTKNMKGVETEIKRSRVLLQRLLDITLFLSRQNLAFHCQGEDESLQNRGNFWELVQTLLK